MKLGARDRLAAVVTGDCAGERSGGSVVSMGGNGGMAGAGERLGRWRLHDCRMAVTLEPCPMCAGALVNARLGGLVFGAFDPKAGAVGTLYDIPQDQRLNHRLPCAGGMLAPEAVGLLRSFFAARRGSRANQAR